jgi:hypothetical protein
LGVTFFLISPCNILKTLKTAKEILGDSKKILAGSKEFLGGSKKILGDNLDGDRLRPGEVEEHASSNLVEPPAVAKPSPWVDAPRSRLARGAEKT